MILRDNAPTDGNGQPSEPAPTTNADPPSPASAAPAPGPSAEIVLTGTRSIADLETDLAAAQADLEVARAERGTLASQKQKLESDIAYLQDELARLRKITEAPVPPKPASSFVQEERSWIENFIP